MLNPREPAVDRSEQESVQIPRPLQIERPLTGGEVEAGPQRLDLGVEPGPADPRPVGVDRAAQDQRDEGGLIARQHRHQRLVGAQQRLDLGRRQRPLGGEPRVTRKLGLQLRLERLGLVFRLTQLSLEVVLSHLPLLDWPGHLLGERRPDRRAAPGDVLELARERRQLRLAAADARGHRPQRLGRLVAPRNLHRGEGLGGERGARVRPLLARARQRLEVEQHGRQARALERCPVAHLQVGRAPVVLEGGVEIAGRLLGLRQPHVPLDRSRRRLAEEHLAARQAQAELPAGVGESPLLAIDAAEELVQLADPPEPPVRVLAGALEHPDRLQRFGLGLRQPLAGAQGDGVDGQTEGTATRGLREALGDGHRLLGPPQGIGRVVVAMDGGAIGEEDQRVFRTKDAWAAVFARAKTRSASSKRPW